MSVLRIFGLSLILVLGLTFWIKHQTQNEDVYILRGLTMGTTYRVIAHGNTSVTARALKERIDNRLREINRSFSTWIEDSEISQFNRFPENSWITVSDEFARLLSDSIQLSKDTNGLFDVTVGPVVNLWGFGPHKTTSNPSAGEIEEALSRVGYTHIEQKSHTFRKRIPNMLLDFSAVAPGYGVDEVARILSDVGVKNYVVEIGGEVVAHGMSPSDTPWAIAIEKPEENLHRNSLLSEMVYLTEGALATSGSYHRYKKTRDGKNSHIIDPRTGRSNVSALVSVTVYAPTCLTADAIATALMLMGAEEGLSWVENREHVEALFVFRNKNGGFRQLKSSGFKKLTQKVRSVT